MLNVSSEYLAAVRALSKTDRLTGTLKYSNGSEVSLTDDTLHVSAVSIERHCVTGEELEFGTAVIGELAISLRTDQSRYMFSGAKISPVYGILLSDNTWYDVPLGVFTVCETDRQNSYVKLVAYDNLLKLDEDYDGTEIYGTPYDLMVTICELCGVTFGMTEEEVLALPNGDQALQIGSESGCSTYRDCAKVVAQMLASFVVADSSGAIVLRKYSTEPVTTLTKRNRASTKLADYICQYVGLTIQSNKGTFSSYDESYASGLELTIQDAPAWDYGTEDTLQARTDALLAELVQIQYTPANLSIFGDPSLECGDMVTLETDDGDVNTLITGYTWKFRGRMSVESVGKNPYLKNVSAQQSQIIRTLEKQTSENKLIFYSFSNSAELTVSGTEVEPLANVTFVTVEDTSAMFLAQLPVTVTVEDTEETTETETEHTVTVTDSTGAETTITDADGNPLTLKVVGTDTCKTVTPGTVDLEIYYYLNGSLVDYELVQRLHAGPHILSLFYPFAELKGNTNNTWDVRIRCASGSVTVAKRALKATVTGQGLAATIAWDGTLTIEEVIPRFAVRYETALRALSDTVSVETDSPTPSAVTETIGRFSTRYAISFGGFTEEITAGLTVEQNTIDPAVSSALLEWTYEDRYVEVGENGVQLRTAWEYQSAEAEVDSGRMTVVKAVTNDLGSVESVEVST